ncbi:FkbM family methyltransferase [Desulfovibrio sp. JC010]|uniref:FkbM family methyltransferase n=1 Tax=Desulfovibrio sp. JC010 TaxID=2593641 RepID=UPI0013D88817|nr:FkbM family methyltransferase [Desulfovibrio sp. JC010]
MSNQTIVVDENNLEELKRIGSRKRYGDWHVKFYNLNIFCHDLLALHIAIKDIFIQRIYDFSSDKDSPVVIDGGSHIGLFSLYAKLKYPKANIIAFEPDENNLKLLMKNLFSNGFKDVQVVPAGLYESDGELAFSSTPNDGSNLFATETNTVVKVVKLSPYLKTHVDILKLNIEGAEWGVLKEAGNLLRNVKEIIMEYHGFPELGQSLHNILALLDSSGFRYAMHDFDSMTNPATKPPMNLSATTRFYQLVKGVRLDDAGTAKNTYKGVGDVLRHEPISRSFGLDLGTSVCRYYINAFLKSCTPLIHGRALEIAENTYTMQFGSGVTQSDILHVQPTSNATIVGNLETGENIPENAFDCIILTQTIQCIADYQSVLENCYRALKKGGALILTATGLGQISRYDMDRWGEYWRFTDKCLHMLLEKLFSDGEVRVKAYGNLSAAKAYLDGMPAEYFPDWLLDKEDNDYQVLVTGIAVKGKARLEDSSRAPDSIKVQKADPRILMYHRVDTDEIDAQLLCVEPENFDRQLAYLAANRKVLPLTELVDSIESGAPLENCVAITFDDGYADNLLQALPLLEKHQIHATVFVCTGNLGAQGGFWGDKVEYIFLSGLDLPDKLELTPLERSWHLDSPASRIKAHDDIRTLLRQSPPSTINSVLDELCLWAGISDDEHLMRPILSEEELQKLAESPYIEIGAHAMSHANLATMPPSLQRAEIKGSKLLLESITGKKVDLFAYPYGSKDSFNAETRGILKTEGFKAAVAVTQSDLSENVDMQALPRRVVRNWDGNIFADWMENDPVPHDQATMNGRQENLFIKLDAQKRIKSAEDPNKGLRLLYINTHDVAGGAAKSTCRLADIQRQKGHRADILVGNKLSNLPGVHAFHPEPDLSMAAKCSAEGLQFYEFQGSHKLVSHHLVKKADVINVQNLHGHYFNPYSVALLSNFRPIVWTLRDMQSFTGHCAHAFECEKWMHGCGDCPGLSIEPALHVDSTARLWRNKKQIYDNSNLVIVCPSQWMKDKVENSILAGHQIELIYNGVDTEIFQPHDKDAARKEFGLPEKGILVGAVAHGGSLTNQWKGGHFTLQALEELQTVFPDLYFINIGCKEGGRVKDKNIVNIPHISDEATLARLYSALDLYLYTPLADTCPLVVIEALSCGLPVVSFATGGVPNLVRQGVDGFVTPVKDVRALVKAATALIRQPELRKQFALEARKGVLERFRIEDMAAKFDEVYRKAIIRFWRGHAQRKPIDITDFPPEILTDNFLKSIQQVWYK